MQGSEHGPAKYGSLLKQQLSEHLVMVAVVQMVAVQTGTPAAV
jgi:hypothetical protein